MRPGAFGKAAEGLQVGAHHVVHHQPPAGRIEPVIGHQPQPDQLLAQRIDPAAGPQQPQYSQRHIDVLGEDRQVEPDEDVLEDGVAFAGVAKYPMRVKCALLGWMAFKDAVARVTDEAGGAGTEGDGAGAVKHSDEVGTR